MKAILSLLLSVALVVGAPGLDAARAFGAVFGADARAPKAPSVPALPPSLPAAPDAPPAVGLAPALGALEAEGAALARAPEADAQGQVLSELYSEQAQSLGPAPASVAAAGTASFGAPAFSPASPGTPKGPADPSAPEEGRRLYLLSEPLKVEVHLGITAKFLHYALETAWQLLKMAGLWRATGSPWASVPLLALEVVKWPASVKYQSRADLQLRYWWRQRTALKRIARVPGVDWISVLRAEETRVRWFMSSRQEVRGLVLLESSRPLNEEADLPYGHAIAIGDRDRTRLKLRLRAGAEPSPVVWSPSISEVMARTPLPESIAEAWREELRASRRKKGLLGRLFDYDRDQRAPITASLVLPSGLETAERVLTQGSSTEKLLSVRLRDRVWAKTKAFVTRRIAPATGRSISLGESEVQQKDQRTSYGIKAAWRRLQGRLIIVDPLERWRDKADTASRALHWLGVAFFAAAAPALFGFVLPGVALFASAGIASLGVAKFLRKPGPAAAPGAAAVEKSPSAWVARSFATFLALGRRAQTALRSHRPFEEAAGGASAGAFARWLASGLRAAILWLPPALAAMAAGAALGSPLKLIQSGLEVAGTDVGRLLIERPWGGLLSGYLASETIAQALLLGGVFAGARALLSRAGASALRADRAAGALAMGAFLAFLLAAGYPLAAAMPLLGIEAVLLYLYARSRTLLIPLALNALLATASLYSARMLALIAAPGATGALDSLPGIPGFGGVAAVAGVSAGLFGLLAALRHVRYSGWGFLKSAVRREWRRVAAVGRWWRSSRSDASVKSPVAVLSLGAFWGIGVYLASYLAYWAAHLVFPAQEVIPAVLRSTLLMPLDALVYVFLIGASLEELVFRRGLFGWLRARLAKAGGGQRSWFWPAALASSVVFSAIHYLDLGAVLGHLHVGMTGLTRTLMGVYSFSWSGFLGRVAAGLTLASLYHRSRVLLVPLAAHFTSNMLEAIGLRWGLPWLLAAVSAIFVFQLISRDNGGQGRRE